ncbi:MAG: acyclic terpene utilization AtuA family protein [Haloarculaceae archaeon]
MTVRIGAGAGYAGDRIEPAVELARDGDLDYLAFECLGERTLALAQERLDRGEPGHDPRLRERMRRVLPHCAQRDTTVVTNMGAADPVGAAEATAAIGGELGLDLAVASVAGSDVRDRLDAVREETYEGGRVSDVDGVVAADAYLGVEGIVAALEADADVVITDRVADTSLFLGPLVAEFGWSTDPLSGPVGQGVVTSHLLECAGQVTGGYFADPGYKDVEGLADLGFPLAEVDADGGLVVTKLPDVGGEVTVRTCTEQLLYEVHDPSEYITPDVVADFSGVEFERVGQDRIRVTGASARPRTDTLKVNVCYEDSHVGEGSIGYAGPGALERADLAGSVVEERLERRGVEAEELRVDRIGVDSLHGDLGRRRSDTPYEVRLRVAARCRTERAARTVANEVETLYTNGPAGGGGVTTDVRRVVGIASTLIDRDLVAPTVTLHPDGRSVEVPG